MNIQETTMEILQKISENLQKGDDKIVSELTKTAIENNLEPKVILDEGLIAGMTIIGEKFKLHDIFLPDVLLAARAMYAGMELLKPLWIKEGVPTIGKIILGTVQGDLHDIGKNLVAIMLKGAGFEVIDIGTDVPPEKFIEEATKENADIIGMSTLLTTTMPAMKKVIELAKKRGIYKKIKIMVGGAPLSSEYAEEIGADAYGYDGINAVECAKRIMSAK